MNKDFVKDAIKVGKKIHVTKIICNHVMGKNHSINHRVVVGIIFIYSGVLIAGFFQSGILHIIFDGVGYCVHGIGSIPLVEKIYMIINDEPEDNV